MSNAYNVGLGHQRRDGFDLIRILLINLLVPTFHYVKYIHYL